MENKKKGKEFLFGDNVTNKYGVAFGLGIVELIKVLSVPTAITIVLFILPPYTLLFILVKLFLALVLFTVTLAFITTKPVNARPNINLKSYLGLKRKYGKRQRLFYKRGKERGIKIER